MRDSQKGKFWKALWKMPATDMSLDECQTFAEKVARWLGDHLKTAMPAWRVRHVIIKDGRRRRSPMAQWSNEPRTIDISLPKGMRNKWIVCWGVAFMQESGTDPDTGAVIYSHGRSMAGLYMKMIRHWLGVSAYDSMREAFTEHHVRWHPKRKKAPLTGGQKMFLQAMRTKAQLQRKGAM